MLRTRARHQSAAQCPIAVSSDASCVPTIAPLAPLLTSALLQLFGIKFMRHPLRQRAHKLGGGGLEVCVGSACAGVADSFLHPICRRRDGHVTIRGHWQSCATADRVDDGERASDAQACTPPECMLDAAHDGRFGEGGQHARQRRQAVPTGGRLARTLPRLRHRPLTAVGLGTKGARAHWATSHRIVVEVR